MLFCDSDCIVCTERIEISSYFLFGIELSVNILSHKERVSADKVVKFGDSHECIAATDFPAWLGAAVDLVCGFCCFHFSQIKVLILSNQRLLRLLD